MTVGVTPIDETRRTSFDTRAEQYDAMRPSYPEALVDDLLARTGARRIVEIGAGTGKATTVFARRDCTLVALEPGEKLAAILRRNVSAFPNVTVEQTRFEDWSPGERPFDLVFSAQAFHWIDPATRYAKSARIARQLAIITNEKSELDSALRAELDDAYSRWFPADDKERVRDAVAAARRAWTDDIDGSGRFGPVHVGLFPWETTYTSSEYIALIDTYSDHVSLDEERRSGLYDAIAGAIDRHGGQIKVRYVAMAFIATAR